MRSGLVDVHHDPRAADSSGAAGGGAPAASGGSGGACPAVPEDCATAADDDCDGTANDHCALWHYQHKEPSFLQLPFAVAIDPAGGQVVAVGQTSAGRNDNAMIVGVPAGGAGVPWVLGFGDGEAQEAQSVWSTDDGTCWCSGSSAARWR